MLSDTARKLLVIMRNSESQRRGMPTLEELKQKSGRKEDRVIAGLRELAEAGHIEWQPGITPDRAKIVEGWERKNPSHKLAGPPVKTTNDDYWKYY